MQWDKIDSSACSVTFREEDAEELRVRLQGFWHLFASDVLPRNSTVAWDHLAITLRGVDGRFGVYQDKLDTPRATSVFWSNVNVVAWEKAVDAIPMSDDPHDKTFEPLYAEQDNWLATIIEEAAKDADLAELASLPGGRIRLRFFRYDETEPFRDVWVSKERIESA